MSKRPSAVIASSQRPWSSQPPPFKRAKKDTTAEPEITIIDDGLSSIPDTSSEAETELPPPVRDPEFYYEDGSITFRVGDVLFKVHASRLKLESGDFEKAFDVPPKLENAVKARGTCDENPIIVLEVKASQFRALMKLIYRPRYIDLFASNVNTWQQFLFYLNVAILANRFAMARIERWARPELAGLVKMSGKMLLEGADVDKADNLNDDGDEHEDSAATRDKNTDTVDGRIKGGEAASGAQGTINGEPNITERGTSTSNNDNNLSDLAAPNLNSMGNITQPNNANDVNEGDRVNKENKENSTGNATNSSSSSSSSSEEDSDKSDGDENEEMETDDSGNEASLPPEEDEDPTFQLMDAVLYAESVSDTSLHHDVRNVLQYHCVNPKNLPVATIVDLFKVADLQERDPSMFGFLFVLLLCKGNQVWKQDLFTRMDRMAFFSAQSYLTPLPDSLKTFVVVPLFKKPISSRSFATIFSETTTDKDCIEKCFVQAFTHWQEIFDEAYYTSISNKDTLAPIKALVSIPCRRLALAQKLSTSECEHECHWKLLSQVDRDTQGLYARLAEYYQGIE